MTAKGAGSTAKGSGSIANVDGSTAKGGGSTAKWSGSTATGTGHDVIISYCHESKMSQHHTAMILLSLLYPPQERVSRGSTAGGQSSDRAVVNNLFIYQARESSLVLAWFLTDQFLQKT